MADLARVWWSSVSCPPNKVHVISNDRSRNYPQFILQSSHTSVMRSTVPSAGFQGSCHDALAVHNPPRWRLAVEPSPISVPSLLKLSISTPQKVHKLNESSSNAAQCGSRCSDFAGLNVRKSLGKRRSWYSLPSLQSPPVMCLAGDQPQTSSSSSSSHEKVPAVSNPSATDSDDIASHIKYHAKYSPVFSPFKFELKQAYMATAQSVRDTLLQRWNETYTHFQNTNGKAIHYLSMEFLQGRALTNAVGNLELKDEYAQALLKLGHDLELVAEQEPDPALGNGGLGRLASCFLDSLATLNYPAWGYGLRYKYGLFHQDIDKDGQQETAENWLEMGYPWEIVRHDISYQIKFFGKTVESYDGKKQWVGGENVRAVAYDVPIPGYRTKNTICLRLWSTKVCPTNFNLSAFNAGEYDKACSLQNNAERICYVLYPGDATEEGKLLRLKQQYTLCSASIQDIVSRYKEWSGGKVNWSDFPTKVAIQMNDTHPTLSIPELMRILLDNEGLPWDDAWKITQATVAYTNHTVLPEALEKWPLHLLRKLLPRHMEIIQTIDEKFIKLLATKVDKDKLEKKIATMRILENVDLYPPLNSLLPAKQKLEPQETDHELELPKPEALVRMANLCVISGNKVNGVAAIHTEIVKEEVFNDFYKLWPEKFQNKTNGITPRRWLAYCNPELSKVITKWLGSDDWVLHTELLADLRKNVANQDLQKEWRSAKKLCKQKLGAYIKEKTGYTIDSNSMFDIQVKRIHEYKRQLMNIMGVIHRYKKMKQMTPTERLSKYVPRVCIFGGKAFATYLQAKLIVRLITDVAATVNTDPEIGDLLKVIFIPDYNVSVAEMLIPASDLSQHISTAGMEASGTSNMKFIMNGCVLIGTLDGANVEIREEVGAENFFLFGAHFDEIKGLRAERAAGKFTPSTMFQETKVFMKSGVFGDYEYTPLLETLEGNSGMGKADYFLLGKDFPAYVSCQEEVDKAYRDQDQWTKMSILNTAGSYKFSSDRTIHEYAKDIWKVKPSPVL